MTAACRSMSVEQSEESKTEQRSAPDSQCPAPTTSDKEKLLPSVGEDLGRIGEKYNGSVIHPGTTKTLTAKEHKEAIRKAKIDAYNKGLMDSMSKVQKIRGGLVEAGADIIKKLNDGGELTAREVTVLKIIMENVTKVEERVVGKVRSESDVNHNFNIVNFISGNQGIDPELLLEAEAEEDD